MMTSWWIAGLVFLRSRLLHPSISYANLFDSCWSRTFIRVINTTTFVKTTDLSHRWQRTTTSITQLTALILLRATGFQLFVSHSWNPSATIKIWYQMLQKVHFFEPKYWRIQESLKVRYVHCDAPCVFRRNNAWQQCVFIIFGTFIYHSDFGLPEPMTSLCIQAYFLWAL